jgi:hypothetical protein
MAMFRLLLVILLLSPLSADISLAQANAITIMCEDCRHPNEYPDDYVNFAFNQIYGPDAWLSFEQADDFFVTNLDGQNVYVDADFVSLGLGYKGFGLPFWPTNILQFTLALPDGTLITALRSIFQTSLPVPSSPDDDGGTTDDTASSGGGSGGDADDEYGDAEEESYNWDDLEFEEYEGYTDIEDPDEFGEFDDDDWCQEC